MCKMATILSRHQCQVNKIDICHDDKYAITGGNEVAIQTVYNATSDDKIDISR